MTRAQVFEALWQDAAFVRMNARKDKLNRAVSLAEAYGRADLEQLRKRFSAAMKRICKYEDVAMLKAGGPRV